MCCMCTGSACLMYIMFVYLQHFYKIQDSRGAHVFALNQLDLSHIGRPRALSSVLVTLGTLQLRPLGLLICIDFIDSLSNYYLELTDSET